ncbi:MAG: hypothetical protein MRJ65_06475 [Candidatus Brocadiaceae bacterium]|nr:hypothetical protein [Candidatus Brocadiaceae bacterium]
MEDQKPAQIIEFYDNEEWQEMKNEVVLRFSWNSTSTGCFFSKYIHITNGCLVKGPPRIQNNGQ